MKFQNKIAGINIAKFSREIIYKPSVQSEILQNYQEVKVINQNYREKNATYRRGAGVSLQKKPSEI